MDGSKELFLSTSPRRLFRMAAIPGAVSMLAATLFNLIDGIFIGQVCGDLAFAAANLAFPFTIIDFALAEMIGTGSSVPISISLGRGKEQKANNYFSCACILIVLTGFLAGTLLYFGAEPIMGLMGAERELRQMAVDFLKVYAVCSPVVTMTYALTIVTRWFGFAVQSLFTALDKPVPATILSLGYACVVPLVLMAVLWNAGLDGLWLNSPLTSLLISVTAGFMLFFQNPYISE